MRKTHIEHLKSMIESIEQSLKQSEIINRYATEGIYILSLDVQFKDKLCSLVEESLVHKTNKSNNTLSAKQNNDAPSKMRFPDATSAEGEDRMSRLASPCVKSLDFTSLENSLVK